MDRLRDLSSSRGGILTIALLTLGALAVVGVPVVADTTFDGEISFSGSEATDGTSWVYEIDDLEAVEDLSVELEGKRVTEERSTSTTTEDGTLDVEPRGTSDPEEAVMTLEGARDTEERSTSATASDGGSFDVDVGGSTDAEDATVTLTGVETRDSFTASGTGDDTISVDGNQHAEDISVEFEGDTETQSASESGSVTPDTSVSLDVGGDTSPFDESITVSPDGSVIDDGVHNDDDGNVRLYDGESLEVEMSIPHPGTINQLNIPIDSVSDDGSADVSVRSGGVDGSFTHGDSVASDVYLSPGDNWVDLPGGEDVSDDTITIIITANSVSGDGELRPDFHSGTGETTFYGPITGANEYSLLTEVEIIGGPVSVNGQSLGVVYDGDSETTGLDLSRGSNTVDISGEAPGVDYTATWGERYGTADPSIDLSGDGSPDASHSGVLMDGETATEPVSDGTLDSGSNAITASTVSGPDPSWTIDGTEVTTTEDTSVEVGGETVTHDGILDDGETVELSGGSLSPGSNTLDVSTGGGSEVDVATDWTEVTATEDPSVSVGESTVSHTGVLEPGETVSDSVTLGTGSDSIDVDTGGEVTVDTSWTEVTESVDPTISVNGYTTSHEGTLADGETESLATNEGWLEEGTNTVTVSTDSPEVGPESLVGFEYAHDASGTTRSVDVEATSWTETFNISHTYPSETADAEATLTFVDSVAEINDVEYRIDGGEWQPAKSSSLDGTDLTVEFGDVAADTEIDVRATGHKIRTYDGEVDVIEPTVEGDELATEVEITEITEDGIFGLRVDETVLGDRVHYASEQSWPGADAHAEVTASGNQILRAPDANVGSTMTVESSPVEVAPETGAIEVLVEDGTEPRFQLRQGDTVGTDSVDVTYHDTLSGERYVLWSETREVEVDADRATSPVTFTTDGSAETYSVLQRDASASEDPPGGPSDTRSTLPLLLSFGGIAVVLVGTTVVGRRLDTGGRLLPITATSLTAIAIHVLAPTSPIERVAVLAYQSDVVPIAAVGLLLVGLWQLDERTEGEVPWYIRGVVGVLSVVWALETISPGVVLGGLREGVSTMGPLLVGALVLGGGYLAREALRARRADAQTPDDQTTIEVRGFGEEDD